eukprot:758625-Hanusia_phi.AAC.6
MSAILGSCFLLHLGVQAESTAALLSLLARSEISVGVDAVFHSSSVGPSAVVEDEASFKPQLELTWSRRTLCCPPAGDLQRRTGSQSSGGGNGSRCGLE